MINYYPTAEHKKAAERIVDIFSQDNRVMTILLVASCARGKASRDSCLDIEIIVRNIRDSQKVYKKFARLAKTDRALLKLRKVGKFSHVDFHVHDGKVEIAKRNWTSGPDDYEVKVGNIYKYSAPLFDRNNYFVKLKKKYLPYYSEKLRKKRLKEAKMYLFNNLDHIPLYVKRKLYFQSFDRLYKAN